MARGQRDELFALAVEERIGADKERADACLDEAAKAASNSPRLLAFTTARVAGRGARPQLRHSRNWTPTSGSFGFTSTPITLGLGNEFVQ